MLSISSPQIKSLVQHPALVFGRGYGLNSRRPLDHLNQSTTMSPTAVREERARLCDSDGDSDGDSDSDSRSWIDLDLHLQGLIARCCQMPDT